MLIKDFKEVCKLSYLEVKSLNDFFETRKEISKEYHRYFSKTKTKAEKIALNRFYKSIMRTGYKEYIKEVSEIKGHKKEMFDTSSTDLVEAFYTTKSNIINRLRNLKVKNSLIRFTSGIELKLEDLTNRKCLGSATLKATKKHGVTGFITLNKNGYVYEDVIELYELIIHEICHLVADFNCNRDTQHSKQYKDIIEGLGFDRNIGKATATTYIRAKGGC